MAVRGLRGRLEAADQAAAQAAREAAARAKQRLRKRATALRRCRKAKSRSKRGSCEARVKKKFGPPPAPVG
ncbi:MAG TPA: hypothetical protein VMF55_16680 [Solirubrobacterales bacterium]|nr:hypothetical protein [Solirubrobacterales bacterium]